MHRWNKFHQYLLDTYKHIPEAERGFLLEKIEQVRIAQEVDYLPPIYVTFLHDFGKVRHQFSGVRHHKESASHLYGNITEHGLPRLPPDAFYLFSDLDIVLFYFQTASEDPNPPVFKIGEERHWVVHRQFDDSLVSFLISMFGVQDMFT